MLVARADEIGLGGERGNEHHIIIIGIGRHGAGERDWFDDPGKDALAFNEYRNLQLLLGQTPREPLAWQNADKLLNQRGTG